MPQKPLLQLALQLTQELEHVQKRKLRRNAELRARAEKLQKNLNEKWAQGSKR